MKRPDSIILYVDNVEASTEFYSSLLGISPEMTYPEYVQYALGNGLTLGLWARHTVAPAATPVGGAELCFPLAEAAALDALFASLQAKGVTVAQAPTTMCFGYIFLVQDPDGHRLRFYVPAV